MLLVRQSPVTPVLQLNGTSALESRLSSPRTSPLLPVQSHQEARTSHHNQRPDTAPGHARLGRTGRALRPRRVASSAFPQLLPWAAVVLGAGRWALRLGGLGEGSQDWLSLRFVLFWFGAALS